MICCSGQIGKDIGVASVGISVGYCISGTCFKSSLLRYDVSMLLIVYEDLGLNKASEKTCSKKKRTVSDLRV